MREISDLFNPGAIVGGAFLAGLAAAGYYGIKSAFNGKGRDRENRAKVDNSMPEGVSEEDLSPRRIPKKYFSLLGACALTGVAGQFLPENIDHVVGGLSAAAVTLGTAAYVPVAYFRQTWPFRGVEKYSWVVKKWINKKAGRINRSVELKDRNVVKSLFGKKILEFVRIIDGDDIYHEFSLFGKKLYEKESTFSSKKGGGVITEWYPLEWIDKNGVIPAHDLDQELDEFDFTATVGGGKFNDFEYPYRICSKEDAAKLYLNAGARDIGYKRAVHDMSTRVVKTVFSQQCKEWDPVVESSGNTIVNALAILRGDVDKGSDNDILSSYGIYLRGLNPGEPVWTKKALENIEAEQRKRTEMQLADANQYKKERDADAEAYSTLEQAAAAELASEINEETALRRIKKARELNFVNPGEGDLYVVLAENKDIRENDQDVASGLTYFAKGQGNDSNAVASILNLNKKQNFPTLYDDNGKPIA